MAAALLLLGFGGYGLSKKYRATHHKDSPAAVNKQLSDVVTRSTDSPNETPVTGDYKVAADMPRRLIMNTIGETGYIQKVGVDQHSAIAVPTNVNFAGWYVDSVKPGQPGLSIIDGHVQGYYNPGIFKRLGELAAGSNFTVEYGDMTLRNFTVTKTASYSAADATKQLFRRDSGIASQLNLITCSGRFNSSTKAYDKRTIVTAKLIQ